MGQPGKFHTARQNDQEVIAAFNGEVETLSSRMRMLLTQEEDPQAWNATGLAMGAVLKHQWLS